MIHFTRIGPWPSRPFGFINNDTKKGKGKESTKDASQINTNDQVAKF